MRILEVFSKILEIREWEWGQYISENFLRVILENSQNSRMRMRVIFSRILASLLYFIKTFQNKITLFDRKWNCLYHWRSFRKKPILESEKELNTQYPFHSLAFVLLFCRWQQSPRVNAFLGKVTFKNFPYLDIWIIHSTVDYWPRIGDFFDTYF